MWNILRFAASAAVATMVISSCGSEEARLDTSAATVKETATIVTSTTRIRPSTTTSSPARDEGPSPIAFDLCREFGPQAVAEEMGLPSTASFREIAEAYASDLFVAGPVRQNEIESCVLGFEASR